nr:MAG TPA: hypothetical protein [Caudoviricetes sp.]
MIDPNKKYGTLITPDILLQRTYFKQMVELLGVWPIYLAPRPGKYYTTYAEIKSNYQEPEQVGCIFDEHPPQRTMKKLGWDSELQENASVISVPYDLHDLQPGALFIIPSAFDNTKGRLFRVAEISGEMIYPASLTCKLVPEFEDTLPESKKDFKRSDFNLLAEEDEECDC